MRQLHLFILTLVQMAILAIWGAVSTISFLAFFWASERIVVEPFGWLNSGAIFLLFTGWFAFFMGVCYGSATLADRVAHKVWRVRNS